MLKRKFVSFFLILSMILSVGNFAYAEGNDESESEAQPETAWITFGRDIESKSVIYTDGYSTGVTDKEAVGYSELFEADGIYGRKVYKANYIDIKLAPEYYEPSDKIFKITIDYYDFGPSPGTFGVFYSSPGNNQSEKRMQKDAIGSPCWCTKSLTVTNAAFGTNQDYDIRLQSNLYNAFARIEILNIDKAIRDGINLKSDTLTSSAEAETLEKLGLMTVSGDNREEYFMQTISRGELITLFVRAVGRENEALSNKLATTFTDVDETLAPYLAWAESKGIVKGAGDGRFLPDNKASVRQLLAFYIRYLGLDEDEMQKDPLDFARQHKMLTNDKYIFQADGTLSRDQFAGIAYKSLIADDGNYECIMKNLVREQILTDQQLDATGDLLMKGCKYFITRKYKPVDYKDVESGRMYHLVDFEGYDAIRAYFTAQQWDSTATKFIIGVQSDPGMMLEYDTENETMTLLDFADCSTNRLEAYVNGQDKIFYEKKDGNGTCEHWVMDWKTNEKKFVAKLPASVTAGENVTPSDDGTLMSVQWNQLSDPRDFYDGKARTRVLATLDIETGEYDPSRSYEFDVPGESHEMGHQMLNPVTKDLMMFCHEGTATDTKDRIWMCDLKTGECWNVFKQAENEDGTTAEPSTHEVWTPSGESIVFVKCPSNQTLGEYGVCRVKPDGSDREYFTNPGYRFWHCSATEDGNWVAGDENLSVAHIVMTDTRTYEPYCLVTYNAGSKWPNDPYQPHVTFERGGRKICWEMYNIKGSTGSYGFAWMDIEDITAKPLEGGRIKYNDEIDYVSYHGSKIEAKNITFDGRECLEAGFGKKIYFDINDDYAKGSTADVKISFSYVDNSRNPLRLKYTTSVEKVTDLYKQENASVEIQRKNTNQWKTAEFTLKDISLNNSAKHLCDFVIEGDYSLVKVSDIKVEVLKTNGNM